MNENNIFPTTKLKIVRKVRIRRDDRPYHEGDFLKLKVYENGTFTGEKSICKVSYIYRGELCKEGYSVMSIEVDGNTEMLR